MQIQVKYFARFRELLACDEERIDLGQSGLAKITDIIQLLTDRGGEWSKLFNEDRHLLCSKNHEVVSLETEIQEGDEIAFFPPVTGG